MAFSFRDGEQAFINRLRHEHHQGTIHALGAHRIIQDMPDNPAYVAMILAPNGDEHAKQHAQTWTAPATQWIALAHEILYTLVPSNGADQLRVISDKLADVCALIEGLPDHLAGR